MLSIGCANNQKVEKTDPVNNKKMVEAESLLYQKPALALQKSTEIAEESNQFRNRALLLKAMSLAILGKNDEAIGILKELIIKEEADAETEIKSNAQLELGKILYYKGNYDSALQVFNHLIFKPENGSDSIKYGWILLFQGKVLRAKGEYAKSQHCYIRGKEIAKRYNDRKLMARLLISTGKNNIVEGNRDLALTNYLEACKLSESIHDYLLSGDVYNHMGGYYLESEQAEKALEYHFKALQSRKLLESPDEIGQSYNNIGKSFLELSENDSARHYFNLSIKMFEKSHYLKGIVKTLTNLGKLDLRENKTNSAKKNLIEAFFLSNKAGYNLGSAEASVSIGDLFLSQNKPDSAIYYYRLCMKKLESSDYENLLIDIYSGMYKAYKMKKDYVEALNIHEKLFESEKHKLNVENNHQMANLLIEFEFERKEKDSKILREENEIKSLTIKRNKQALAFVVIALVLSVLLCILILSRLKYKEKSNKQLNNLNAKIRKQNHDLEILNNDLQIAIRDKDKLFSIISHELRNPLFWFQNLTAMLAKNFRKMDEFKLQKSITSLNDSAQNIYHLMDNLLFWSRSRLNRIIPNRSEIILKEKIGEVSNLFKNIIETKGIEFKAEVPEDLNIVADPELLSCILRNLISNAIKYTPENGIISISTYCTNTHICFEISDTGTGFDHLSFEKIINNEKSFSLPGILNEQGSGLGLKLCKEFIEMHSGTFWLDPSAQNGTKICFSIYQHPVLKSKNIRSIAQEEKELILV